MKKHLILSLLIFSSLSFSQTTVLNRLKVNGSTKKNDATRVVVQDSLTKEYHWALKDNFLALTFANIGSALGYTPANDVDVVHKTGDETIEGLKTFTEKITGQEGLDLSTTTPSTPIINLSNPDVGNRTVKISFNNQSTSFALGMEDSSATMFQIKEGSSSYFNVNRTDGKIAIGKNSGVPEKTLTVKDNSVGGSTGFRIQAGDTQTDNFISCLYNNNTQGFTVDKNSNILYEKNLNKVIVISGDSFSNDVSQFGNNGDFPTYFLYNQNNHDWQHVVTAVAGRTVATMLANYNTEILPYARNYEHQERMLILYGGVNDIFANRTAADIYNDLKSMWLNAKNNGFKTVAFRICESTDLTAPQEAERVALNNLISSDKSLYDYLIYADVLFPDASDVTFFADGTHLNYVGAEYLGRNVYNTIYEDKFFTLASNSIISGYKENTYTKNPLIGNGDFTENIAPLDFTQKKYVDYNRLKSYTVATLPVGTAGDTAYVTDATSPTYLGALTGGGSVKCPVFYNGTTWVSH